MKVGTFGTSRDRSLANKTAEATLMAHKVCLRVIAHASTLVGFAFELAKSMPFRVALPSSHVSDFLFFIF